MTPSELSHLYDNNSKRYDTPLSSEEIDNVCRELIKQGSVVIGTTILAVDQNHFFENIKNPSGKFIIGASDIIVAASNSADEKGVMEAVKWASCQPALEFD